MIFLGNGRLKFEEGEPILRSCWNCNKAHLHLKNANYIINCFECDGFFIRGKNIKKFKTDEDFDNFFIKQGLKIGDSTINKERFTKDTNKENK